MRRLANPLLWGGCAVALLGATQPWWSAGERTAVSGTQATSGAALALVLAAVAGAFLSRWLPPVARRIVLGLVAVLALGGIPVALGATAPALPGSTLGDALTLVATAWRWVYLAGVVLAGAGAVLTLLAGPPTTRPARTPDPAMDAWKALDAGQDPTVEPERGVGGAASSKPTE
ncbi:MAG: hypothetical protein QM582_01080 [Micropruina sp.]|uniref:hypothetical protein n=1 Tax=Micropruina sp. TaxID=2737536 RepID=UPI0039E5D581